MPFVAARWETVAGGAPFAPYRDAPGDLWVLGRRLADWHAAVAEDVGLARDGGGGARLVVRDDVWITAAAVRRFLDQCPPEGGQLRVDGPFLEATAALQGLADGRLPVWAAPEGADLAALPSVTVDLGVDARPVPRQHPALDGAETRPLVITDAMVHTLSHWTHLHRVNLLALVAWSEGERRRIAASWWRSLLAVLGIVWRARSLVPHALAAAIGPRGQRVRVHPTAVIEASVLGDDVEVGPFAVVRGAWVGAGAKIAEHARVAGSVVGEGCTVARGCNLQLSVALPGAYVSEGRGHQACVFGRDAFVAVGVTTFDLSFGGEVRVRDASGVRVPAGTRFLGSAVGHRARVGPHVRINFGEVVPNDALLVGDPDQVARDIPDDLADGPWRVVGGVLTPSRRGPGPS